MWEKIKTFFSHSRTILAARLVTFAGAAVALEPIVAGQDWTPVLTRIYGHLPPDLQHVAIGMTIVAGGELFAYLRRLTSTPLADNKGT